MYKRLLPWGIIIALILRTAIAADIRYIQVGDIYYLYHVIDANARVIVQYVDRDNNRVKIRHANGAVDWVSPADLMTQADSDTADVVTGIGLGVIVIGGLVCLFSPDTCKDKSSAQASNTSNKVTVTLVNEHCAAVDYYVNDQLAVSSLPGGYQTSFSVSPGNYETKACLADSSNCGSTVTRDWSADDVATIRAGEGCATRAGISPWPLAPLVSGDWNTVPDDEFVKLTKLLAADNDIYRGLADRIVRLRSYKLPFYRDVVLYEGQLDGSAGLVTFLLHSGKVSVIDGKSDAILALNKSQLSLDSDALAEAYLRFFSAAIQGSDGNFRIIDAANQLSWAGRATNADRAAVDAKLVPLSFTQRDDAGWEATATLGYANAVFKAEYRINRDGTVEMIQDMPLLTDLPIMPVKYGAGVRYEDATAYGAGKG